jgi:hypothetical protein
MDSGVEYLVLDRRSSIFGLRSSVFGPGNIPEKEKGASWRACAFFDLYLYYITFRGVNESQLWIYLSNGSNELRGKGQVLLLTRFGESEGTEAGGPQRTRNLE